MNEREKLKKGEQPKRRLFIGFSDIKIPLSPGDIKMTKQIYIALLGKYDEIFIAPEKAEEARRLLSKKQWAMAQVCDATSLLLKGILEKH